ncbi:MAG: hypothetical protein AAF909_13040 [Pseudomonadota bacterium]
MQRFFDGHPRHGELAESFPAACVAMADRRRPPEQRGEAAWLARTGAKRAAIAEALDIPLFLYRFTARDLPGAIPARLPYREPAPELYSALSRRAPPSGHARPWLRRLFRAATAAPPELLPWFCEKKAAETRANPRLLWLFAFHSLRPHLPASRHITEPWAPTMAHRHALRQAKMWFFDVLLDPELRILTLPVFLQSRTRVAGASFTPLLHPQRIEEEGQRLRNCLGQFALSPFVDSRMFFRVDAEGACAVFELQPAVGRWGVAEIKGPRNAPAAAGLCAAVQKWMAALDLQEGAFAPPLCSSVNSDAWRAVWAAYRQWCGPDDWMADAPYPSDLARMVLPRRPGF